MLGRGSTRGSALAGPRPDAQARYLDLVCYTFSYIKTQHTPQVYTHSATKQERVQLTAFAVSPFYFHETLAADA